MNELGAYLRALRNELCLSLNDVYKHTDITTTRLERIELNKINEPSPIALKKLATLYGVDVLDLYKRAGYLENSDTLKKEFPFRKYEELSSEDCSFIQKTINFLANKYNCNKEGEL